MLVFIHHIPLAFLFRCNMVAIHILHKLVLSARLFMKMASWGYCVLVYDSVGEPAARPDDALVDVPGCSGSEFAVGYETTGDDVPSLEKRSPMDCASSL